MILRRIRPPYVPLIIIANLSILLLLSCGVCSFENTMYHTHLSSAPQQRRQQPRHRHRVWDDIGFGIKFAPNRPRSVAFVEELERDIRRYDNGGKQTPFMDSPNYLIPFNNFGFAQPKERTDNTLVDEDDMSIAPKPDTTDELGTKVVGLYTEVDEDRDRQLYDRLNYHPGKKLTPTYNDEDYYEPSPVMLPKQAIPNHIFGLDLKGAADL